MRRLDISDTGASPPESPLKAMTMAAANRAGTPKPRGAAGSKRLQKQANAAQRWRRYYMQPVADAINTVVMEELQVPGWLDRLNATALSHAGQERFARVVHERGLRTRVPGLEPSVALTGPSSSRPRPLRRGDAPFGDERHSRERSYAVLLFLLRHILT